MWNAGVANKVVVTFRVDSLVSGTYFTLMQGSCNEELVFHLSAGGGWMRPSSPSYFADPGTSQARSED
jgi:hypothetical protein